MNLKELIVLGGLGAVALAGIVVSAATKGKEDEPKAAELEQANTEVKETVQQPQPQQVTPQAPVQQPQPQQVTSQAVQHPQQPQDLKNTVVHPVFRVVDENNNVIGTTPTFVPVQ